MAQDARHPLLARLKLALQAKGESKAVDRLELAARYASQGREEDIRSLVLRHCREYGIDPRIILGEDVLSHTPARIVMMPVFAMDVVHPRTGRWGLREIERIALLSRLLGPTRFLTRMEGRALEPRIRHGAYLMVDTAQDLPPAKSPDDASADEAGVPFALDIPGEGLVVRLTRYIDGRDSFELAALDRAVPTFVVPRGEDGCRIVGRVVWVAQEL